MSENEYYLVVGRFVPENNYEAMIREFMKSNSKKDFVLITNVEQNAFYEKLKKETGFDKDSRVKFVGTVYNQELLKYIREKCIRLLPWSRSWRNESITARGVIIYKIKSFAKCWI